MIVTHNVCLRSLVQLQGEQKRVKKELAASLRDVDDLKERLKEAEFRNETSSGDSQVSVVFKCWTIVMLL